MILGFTSAQCIVHMCKLEAEADQLLHCEILENHVFQTLEHYDIERKKFIFQQDNDPNQALILKRICLKKKDRVNELASTVSGFELIWKLSQELKRSLERYERNTLSIPEFGIEFKISGMK